MWTTIEADNTSKDEESSHENKKDKLTASDKGSWYDNLSRIERAMLRPVYTGDFCRGNSMQFLSRLSYNFKIARVNQVRFSVRFVAAISQAFRTCSKRDAILLRQKLHRVAAVKIACVNGPLEGKLTLVSACWSSVDRCPQINSLSCLFLSRFPFTFFWFDDSEHLRYYISLFPYSKSISLQNSIPLRISMDHVIVIGTAFWSDKVVFHWSATWPRW